MPIYSQVLVRILCMLLILKNIKLYFADNWVLGFKKRLPSGSRTGRLVSYSEGLSDTSNERREPLRFFWPHEVPGPI